MFLLQAPGAAEAVQKALPTFLEYGIVGALFFITIIIVIIGGKYVVKRFMAFMNEERQEKKELMEENKTYFEKNFEVSSKLIDVLEKNTEAMNNNSQAFIMNAEAFNKSNDIRSHLLEELKNYKK